jgi:hypothetical protein
MMDDWNSEFFVERLNMGEFDYHLIEAMSRLSTDQLQEVADVLMDEEGSRTWIN